MCYNTCFIIDLYIQQDQKLFCSCHTTFLFLDKALWPSLYTPSYAPILRYFSHSLVVLMKVLLLLKILLLVFCCPVLLSVTLDVTGWEYAKEYTICRFTYLKTNVCRAKQEFKQELKKKLQGCCWP